MQLNTTLSQYVLNTQQGYAGLTQTSRSNPFITYSVINDGSGPGQCSGDGASVSSVP